MVICGITFEQMFCYSLVQQQFEILLITTWQRNKVLRILQANKHLPFHHC